MTTLLLALVSLASAEELTLDQAVAAGLTSQRPASARGSESCACVLLDYGEKGSLRLTADQVTGLQRVTGQDHALYAMVGDKRVKISDGLCEGVALMSLSVAQWLQEELKVVDAQGATASPGCNRMPEPLHRP